MKKLVTLMLAVMLVMTLVPAYAAADASTKDTVVVATSVEPTVYFMQHSELGQKASFAKDCAILYNIYDMLFVINDNGEFEPRLGLGYTVSDDGLTYTVEIRDDAYFSNGEKVTAEDVAFSANLMKEQVPNNARGMFTNFEVAEVVDDTHVSYTLSAPFAAFPNCWTSRCVPVICKSYYEEVGEDGYQENPVGSGPYIFKSKEAGQSVTLVANPDYWGGKPAIENVVFKVIANVNTQFLSLKAGEVDVILNADVASCLQLDGRDLAYADGASGTRAVALINTNPDAPNAATNPMLNESIRKAVASCVDRESILIGACEGLGNEQWVEMLATYTGVPDVSTLTQALPYDIDAAKAYLDEGGYNGEKVELLVVSGSRLEKAANVLQASMLEAGINAEVVATDAPTSTNQFYSAAFQIYFLETTGSLYDSSALNNIYTGGTADPFMPADDYTWFKDTITTQMQTTDPEARQALTGELLNFINEKVQALPLYNPASVVAYNTGLDGVAAHPQTYCFLNEWSWK